MERVLEFVVKANTEQMTDPSFVRELKSWVRFNGAEALRTRDGLYSATTGNPAIPTWLGHAAFNWFFRPVAENDKCARQIRSSAGLAVFVGRSADKASWVDVGRGYERFALQATALGIRTAFLNQPVEVAGVRPSFAGALGLTDRRPDLVVRFGHGPLMPYSLRRPVRSVRLYATPGWDPAGDSPDGAVAQFVQVVDGESGARSRLAPRMQRLARSRRCAIPRKPAPSATNDHGGSGPSVAAPPVTTGPVTLIVPVVYSAPVFQADPAPSGGRLRVPNVPLSVFHDRIWKL